MSSSSYQTAGAVRIGDRERDQATDCLRDHMAAGRLDPVEFDHRIEIALTARYAEDLQPLFVDLPAPWPELPTGREPAPEPTVAPVVQPKPTAPVRSSTAGWRAATAVAWTVAIILCVTSGWHLWWLLFVPLLMGGGCGRNNHELRQRRRLAARQLHWESQMRHFDARMERLDRRRW